MTQLSLFPARGFIMAMWTGILEGDNGQPRFFRTARGALAALQQYPAWGRHAVTVYECERHDCDGQQPTYVVGEAVAP